MNRISALIKEDPKRSQPLPPCEDTVEKVPTVNQEEDSHQNVTLVAP